MTEEQIIYHLNKMQEEFGVLPDSEHEPVRFAYFVKLYRYLYNV